MLKYILIRFSTSNIIFLTNGLSWKILTNVRIMVTVFVVHSDLSSFLSELCLTEGSAGVPSVSSCGCCLPTPMPLAIGRSPIFPRVVQ